MNPLETLRAFSASFKCAGGLGTRKHKDSTEILILFLALSICNMAYIMDMQKDDSLFSRLKRYGPSYFIKTVTAILSLLITYCSSSDAHDHQSLLKKSPQTRHSYFLQ